MRALAAGSARGFDMDEYRLDVAATTPRDEAGAEPPWVKPASRTDTHDESFDQDAASPVLSVSRLRTLTDEPGENGPRSSRGSAALESLRSDRRVQLIALAGALVLALTPMVRRTAGETRLSQIRKHPRSYDGQQVTVRGKVGEVFSMGSSHVYYLLQGKDTLVVFTREEAPLPRQQVKVKGSVSTGYLEGVPRVALFDAGP